MSPHSPLTYCTHCMELLSEHLYVRVLLLEHTDDYVWQCDCVINTIYFSIWSVAAAFSISRMIVFGLMSGTTCYSAIDAELDSTALL